MMTWKVRIIIIIGLFLGLTAMVNLIRKRKLELKYALTWLFLGAALLFVVLVPNVLDILTVVVGIYNPMNMVFCLAFLFLIAVIFVLTISISNNSNRVRKMAQMIALNDYKTSKNV